MSSAHRGGSVSPGRAAAVAVALTLAGHYAWELAQAQWFAEHAGAGVRSYVWHCFVAAWGDVLIAAMSYVLAAMLLRRARWLIEPRVIAPALVWLAGGLAITVVVEIWATASGRWSYASTMPAVLGIGGLPLAQWVVVPTLTLVIFRNLWRATR